MKFCIEKNGSLVIGGSSWNQRLAKLCGLSNNKNAPNVPYELEDGGTLREYKVVPASPSWYQSEYIVQETLVGSVWTVTQGVVDYPLDHVKSILGSKITPLRYQKEIAGVQIDTYKVDTDRESQLKMIGLLLEAQTDPLFTVKWKMYDGTWSLLDATQAAYLAKAASKHVADCYAREESLQKELESATNLEEVLAIDLESGWPTNILQEV